ncbi:MAG: hypothetical protein H6936_16350 [Burkholderiales bacterium]|nr:hypothetical protein [Nitrosomonas sp.]MCP5276384.1 hypothetical protein [Burkholderiales bacterium]
MSAESHLAKFGVTVPQALNFLVANVGQPETIFNVASQFAITTEMLGEITNLSPDIVSNYFAASGFDSSELDDTSILVNADLGDLKQFVGFNKNDEAYADDVDKISEVLSTESLRGFVQPLLSDPASYDSIFGPQFPFQANGGVYDAEELGVDLGVEVQATNESIESLFYGSLINMFSAFDQTELTPIVQFPVGNRNSEEFKTFVSEAFTDVPEIVLLEDDLMVRLVVNEAVILINELGAEDSAIVGVLDQSFLGLAVG